MYTYIESDRIKFGVCRKARGPVINSGSLWASLILIVGTNSNAVYNNFLEVGNTAHARTGVKLCQCLEYGRTHV